MTRDTLDGHEVTTREDMAGTQWERVRKAAYKGTAVELQFTKKVFVNNLVHK